MNKKVHLRDAFFSTPESEPLRSKSKSYLMCNGGVNIPHNPDGASGMDLQYRYIDC